MSKKLMLLAAGALSALAFAALPAFASAEELQVHCPTAPCVGTISGSNAEHAIRIETDNGEKIEATGGLAGSISISAATTTTGTIELEIMHVVEKISGFNFTCSSSGAAAGIVKTGALVTHFINLTTGGTNPAVLMTLPAAGVTVNCASGLVTKTVTGSLMGTITTANCNAASATNVVTFNIKSGTPGTQEHELWTGKSYTQTSGTHASDQTASAQSGRGNITWQVANKPTLTCP